LAIALPCPESEKATIFHAKTFWIERVNHDIVEFAIKVCKIAVLIALQMMERI